MLLLQPRPNYLHWLPLHTVQHCCNTLLQPKHSGLQTALWRSAPKEPTSALLALAQCHMKGSASLILQNTVQHILHCGSGWVGSSAVTGTKLDHGWSWTAARGEKRDSIKFNQRSIFPCCQLESGTSIEQQQLSWRQQVFKWNIAILGGSTLLVSLTIK